MQLPPPQMHKSINRRWNHIEEQQLSKLYLKQKISIKRICEILDRSPCIINPKQGSYRGAYSLDISRKFTPEYFQKIGSLRFKI